MSWPGCWRGIPWRSPWKRITASAGVGSLVAEVIAERGLRCRLVRCGVDSLPNGITGSQRYLHGLFGLSAEKLVETALAAARKNKL